MRSTHRVRVCAPVAGAILVAAVLISPSTWAHAVIVAASPAAGAEIAAVDGDVSLRFNSRIDHRRSRLTLIAADGGATALSIRMDSSPDMMVARMSGLAPGQYRLRWQVLAVDGHLTRGDVPFRVKSP